MDKEDLQYLAAGIGGALALMMILLLFAASVGAAWRIFSLIGGV